MFKHFNIFLYMITLSVLCSDKSKYTFCKNEHRVKTYPHDQYFLLIKNSTALL